MRVGKVCLLPCGCEDETCDQCLAILELNQVIKKTSCIYYDSEGGIELIVPTDTVMEYKRIMREK
jgi:hypothetical protein